MDWLRMVSLMDQLSVIDTDAIRAVIEQTNYMVVNRLKASSSIKFKHTRHIMTDNVDHPLSGAKIVSLAPDVSLGTIGSTIPVIDMPEDMAYPTLRDMAYVLTQIGHMVMGRKVPTHSIEGLGDETHTISNLYAKGRAA